MHKAKLLVLVALTVVLGLIIAGYLRMDAKQNKVSSVPAVSKQTEQDNTQVPQNPNSKFISLSEAASETVVVNKKHPLPPAYTPASLTNFGSGQLRAHAATALSRLFIDANNNGMSLKLINGYRSYETWQVLFDSYVNRFGKASASQMFPRPGFSEHQTGLAADVGLASGICDLELCFADTTTYEWLVENAQNYGFIIRYPKDMTDVTGYQFEPWHLRYVGVDTAKAIKASGKTLDEYFNIPAGDYE